MGPKESAGHAPPNLPSHLSPGLDAHSDLWGQEGAPEGPGPPPPPRPGAPWEVLSRHTSNPAVWGTQGPLPVLQSWRFVYLGNISGWRSSGIGGLKIRQSLPGRVTSLAFERVGRSQPEKPRVEMRELREVVDLMVGSEGQRPHKNDDDDDDDD